MVSSRPISVCAISTGIALEQEKAEEGPRADRDMVQMLRRQMLRTCAREDPSWVLPLGKRREETPLEMAPTTPRTRTRKEFRGRQDPTGEGGERKNSTRCRSPTEANPGTVGRKTTITGKGWKNQTGASELPEHDRPDARRNPRTSQNSRGIWFQPSEVEKRVRHQTTRKQENSKTETRASARNSEELGRGC